MNSITAGNLTVSSVFGYQSDDDESTKQQNRNNNYNSRGLSFLPNGPVNLPFLSSSSSSNLCVLHAPSGLVMAATGFAPDAEHILNVAAGRVYSRISVYDAPSSSPLSISSSSSSTSGKSVDPHRLVREDLSSIMINSAMSEGGRPLGIQLLVVGQSALSKRITAEESLEIYTIDPSGGFRSCVGRGSAVGRGAERIRSSLMKERTIDNKINVDVIETPNLYGWRGALERAMMASVDVLDSNNELDGRPRAKYSAIVVFGHSTCGFSRSRQVSKCAIVNPAIVDEHYTQCYAKMVSQKKLATTTMHDG